MVNKGPKYTDLSGQKFNRLTVLNLDHKEQQYNKYGKPAGNTYFYRCRCDCGNEVVVRGPLLKYGSVKSCGCLNKEKIAEFNRKTKTKHGFRSTLLYRKWQSMKGRCLYPSVHGYKNYGGRGITICDEWKDDFNTFKDWALSHGYVDGLSLDRIDPNGNYTPDNCRWTTLEKQAQNRRNNNLVTYNNETHCLMEWSRIIGINRTTLYNRIFRKGWDIERAFTEPLHLEKRRYFSDK